MLQLQLFINSWSRSRPFTAVPFLAPAKEKRLRFRLRNTGRHSNASALFRPRSAGLSRSGLTDGTKKIVQVIVQK